MVGALDDREVPVPGFGHLCGGNRPLVAAIGKDHLDEREQRAGRRVQHQGGTIAVLDIGAVDGDVQQQPERVDKDVVLDALDLLARVVADRVERHPPFSAVRTLWLSITAAVGLASRPACSRTWT